MLLDLNSWPKPVEAFVIGHLYEGVMLMYFRDITCLTNLSTVHFRSGIPHSSFTTGQATISCRRTVGTQTRERWNGVSPSSQTHRQWKSQYSQRRRSPKHTHHALALSLGCLIDTFTCASIMVERSTRTEGPRGSQGDIGATSL